MSPHADGMLDETKRLKSLAMMHIIDSDPDPRFDVFTQLAADIYQTPMALISLVDDDRQWFKSAVGLSLTQTPLAWSFCRFAIQQPEKVFLVEDATLDTRFSSNPLVTSEPSIRFYAGASLRSPSGEALGTLCILDCERRSMTEIEQQRLMRLADGVSALIEMHRQNVDFNTAASIDPLTSVYNRRVFDEKLDLSLSAAFEGRPCSLILLDLDGFKSVNDIFGLQIGDELLFEAANRIKRCVRSTDIVARLGGDEFAIIMTEQTGSKAAQKLLERIYEAFSIPMRLEAQEVSLQVSAGAAHSPLDAQERGALFRAAEMRLFDAKRLKSARIQTNSLYPSVRRRSHTQGQMLERELTRALSDKSLTVVWQPYFSVATGEVHGFEALARWPVSEKKVVSPTVFIPFAEERGLIGLLDEQVLDTAARQAASWKLPAKISVNISAHWFNGPDLGDYVSRLLNKVGLTPDRLCLEITERTVIASWETARLQIAKLRSLGVSVALDDFGIGYSCLSYLRQVPFNKLKLDRSFIRDLGVDERSNIVSKAIIQLGQNLGMVVCGEGVETEHQLRQLANMGCEFAQGYLLGMPNSVPNFDPVSYVLESR